MERARCWTQLGDLACRNPSGKEIDQDRQLFWHAIVVFITSLVREEENRKLCSVTSQIVLWHVTH